MSPQVCCPSPLPSVVRSGGGLRRRRGCWLRCRRDGWFGCRFRCGLGGVDRSHVAPIGPLAVVLGPDHRLVLTARGEPGDCVRGPSWEGVPVVVSDGRKVLVMSGPFNRREPGSGSARRGARSRRCPVLRGCCLWCQGSCVCAYVDVITAVVAASAAISTMAVISVVCFSLAVGIYLIPRPLRFRVV